MLLLSMLTDEGCKILSELLFDLCKVVGLDFMSNVMFELRFKPLTPE
jgi:hypothetical protein